VPNPIINRRIIAAARTRPSDFSNLEFWWKADSFALADGTAIGGAGSEWQDQSANNRDAVQGTAGAQPLFKTNIFGAMPSIRFDGSDDCLEFPVSTWSPSVAFTILVVGKAVTVTDCELLGHNANNEQVRVNNATTVSFFDGVSTSTSTAFGSSVVNAKLISWRRTLVTFDLRFRENKTSRGENIASGNQTVTLNRIGRTSFGGFPNWDIAEIVGYSTALTSAQVDSLYDNYFKPRWGLP